MLSWRAQKHLYFTFNDNNSVIIDLRTRICGETGANKTTWKTQAYQYNEYNQDNINMVLQEVIGDMD